MKFNQTLPCARTAAIEALKKDQGFVLIYTAKTAADGISFQLWKHDSGEWLGVLTVPEDGTSCLLMQGPELKLESTF